MRRPQYTTKEIHQEKKRLPGFDSQGDVFDIFNNTAPINESLWQAVLSLTVVTYINKELHVLAGKRTAEGNATHVNVASTPTMRLAYPNAGPLIGEHVPFNLSGEIDPLRPFVSQTLYPSVAMVPDNTDVLSAPVGHLLAQKLELGPLLETSRRAIGRASLARCIAGFSYLEDTPSGEPLYEPLIMFGALVGLSSEAARQIPKETVSYSNLGWVPIDQYREGVASKRVLDVLPNANPHDELEVCVRGLCNTTSINILSNKTDIERHLSEDSVLEMP